MLFDFLNPDDDKSLAMFFTNKKVLANIGVAVERIEYSNASSLM